MEAVINLLVEESERLVVNPVADITQQGNTYTYQGKNFLYQDNIVASVAALKVLTEFTPTETRQIIQDKIHRILNPPPNNTVDQAMLYDLDITNDNKDDPRTKLTHDYQYWVYWEAANGSCPHHNPSHIRQKRDGLISCFDDTLQLYSRLIRWYEQHKNELPTHTNTIRPQLTLTGKWTQLQRDLIATIIPELSNVAAAIFYLYETGKNNMYDMNTLTRNRLHFDVATVDWVKVDNVHKFETNNQIIPRLDGLLKIEHAVTNNVRVVPLNDIIEAIDLNPPYILQPYIDAYFKGLNTYTHRVFDLQTSTWEVVTPGMTYDSPQVIGNVPIPNENDIDTILIDTLTSDMFCIMISKINTLNLISRPN
jgi:hypothetical protein